MITTKEVSILDNNTTLTAAAADHTSGIADLLDGFGGSLFIKITNGATGPTIVAQSQVWVSADNSNWYKFGGAFISNAGNNIVSSWAIDIPPGISYLKVLSGSNTGQNTTVRVEFNEVKAVA